MVDAMQALNPREQRILEARRLAEPPLTLEDLATEFSVSRERIRQIEVRAFEKLQKAVRDKASALQLLPLAGESEYNVEMVTTGFKACAEPCSLSRQRVFH